MASEDLLAALRVFLRKAPEDVVCAYLFGSAARGGPRGTSDVDVAILTLADPLATLESRRFELAAELERVVRRPVDLVILNDAPADLVHRVLRDGQLLLERDKSARLRFEVRARNEYFDLQPILERYRAGALAHALRGRAG